MCKKIHIGFHKTGSTFLQQIVFPNVTNYKGRYYSGKKDKHTNLYAGKPVKKGCENILKYYSKFNNHFISNEIFTKLTHKDLFGLLEKYSYDKVLVVERNLKDLIKSRKRHKSSNFFLQKKITNNNIDEEVTNHYSTEKLNKKINNLTIINFEKFFSGDKKEIKKLSEFLDCDVEDIVLSNLHRKINEKRKN
tara:strand:- start:3510 stop:4085 length:576 start_codon:yes stop_codon:yes gene_type:complete